MVAFGQVEIYNETRPCLPYDRGESDGARQRQLPEAEGWIPVPRDRVTRR